MPSAESSIINHQSSICLVAALSENGVIGRDGDLPWRLPADLAWLKKVTGGRPVVMGRKTWQSLPNKPLPGRTNIVLTSDPDFAAEGATTARNLDEALEVAGDAERVCILGGEGVFRAALPHADRMYLTRVHAAFEGDTFFPKFDESEWRITERYEHPADENNPHACTFLVYDRIADSAQG